MQSHRQSVVESLTNTFVGLFLSFGVTQLLAFLSPMIPGVELVITLETNALLTAILTVVSIARGYCIRRFFNRRHKH